MDVMLPNQWLTEVTNMKMIQFRNVLASIVRILALF